MRIILGILVEEILSVCQMMFGRRCRCLERRLYSFRMSQLQSPINLIRRDVVKPFSFILFREGFPVQFGSLQQGQGTHHIGLGERKRILDGTVHMTFRRQMDNAIHLFFLHQPVETLKIADVHFHELVVRFVFYIPQIGQIAGVCQFVQTDNVVFRIFVDKQAYYMAPDKSGTTRNDD